jgi:SEC-C motif-containing protein
MTSCPCGSGLEFAECCELIHLGKAKAETAEALMRARYSAYVTANVDFLGESLDEEGREAFDADSAREWAENATWQSFEVVSVEGGTADDDDGLVEFRAVYETNGSMQEHHERSYFQKIDGKWCFIDGEVSGTDPYVREGPKVGRNDPCPCGSGKKHKKCCGG